MEHITIADELGFSERELECNGWAKISGGYVHMTDDYSVHQLAWLKKKGFKNIGTEANPIFVLENTYYDIG